MSCAFLSVSACLFRDEFGRWEKLTSLDFDLVVLKELYDVLGCRDILGFLLVFIHFVGVNITMCQKQFHALCHVGLTGVVKGSPVVTTIMTSNLPTTKVLAIRIDLIYRYQLG